MAEGELRFAVSHGNRVPGGGNVWGRSVPHFEGRQLGRLDSERRELLAFNHLIANRESFAFRAHGGLYWKSGIDQRAVHRFGTEVWEPGFRSG